jgi:UDP-glucose:(heptosyl)LPS alpha-1,3-glucosyltransferase
MHIAFVVHDFNRAFGHGRYAVELASRFAAGHDVHVFANTFDAVPAGVHCHRVPALRVSALSTILSFYPMASLAVSGSFDIVHAQGFSVAGANVITAHISNKRWSEARRTLEGGQLPWRERLFAGIVAPLEHRSLATPGAAIIAVSEALRRDIQAEGLPNQVTVIPHGIDTGQFHVGVRSAFRNEVRHALHVADDEVVFLYVGDLRKGFSRALEGFARTTGRLVAVSRSDPREMRALAQQFGVADRVQFEPATPHIERYYAAGDVFVFPTQYDAFGMVITEAMACGLPVVTTACAGAADLIDDGRTGFIVGDPSDVARLAEVMDQLAHDGALRAQMGQAAATAMLAHSWDHVARQTMAVYERLAGARSFAA